MKNIFLLPTDQPSRLYIVDSISELSFSNGLLPQVKGTKNQHIYITSDEDIKENDWGLSKLNEIILFGRSYNEKFYKKIILTTDPTLIADGVQAVDDDFLKWFVKNPSCEEVEIQCRYNFYAGQDLTYYKIITPQEEPKQDLLPDFSISKSVFDKISNLSSKDLPQEFSKLVNENFDELIKHDWYCPKCQSYVSSESVTFEETHQICNTNVIIQDFNKEYKELEDSKLCEPLRSWDDSKRTFTEEEVLAIIKVSCEQGMYIQRTINDKVNIPYFRIKEFQKQVLENYKNK
jgi:hypothetical protein